MSELAFYDTLRRRIEPFSPRSRRGVRMYSCGPTVYGRQHLGNLRAYVFADLLKRTLVLHSHTVQHVVNITDVGHLTDDGDHGEDKIERAAFESGNSALAITRVWTELFQRDLALLGVEAPTVWAKATEHVPEQVELIQKLEAKGFTYRTADGIYFDTSLDPDYGKLSGLSAGRAHSRLDGARDKRNAADFALWKFSPASGPRRQLEWQSPWGLGFPGWHIECSAMAIRYLGDAIDFHTGGVDHVAVHHPNEIAQSENALGVRGWVNFWMHGAWLTLDGEKISKSRLGGQPPNLDDLAALGVSPATFRYYLYTAHYRSPLTLTGEALRAAEVARRRLRAVARAGGVSDAGPQKPAAWPSALNTLRRKFLAQLAHDLDAPGAIATLWEIANLGQEPVARRGALLAELSRAIGLDLTDEDQQHQVEPLGPRIEALVEARARARHDRNFQLADALRAELYSLGVIIEDGAEGQRVKRV